MRPQIEPTHLLSIKKTYNNTRQHETQTPGKEPHFTVSDHELPGIGTTRKHEGKEEEKEMLQFGPTSKERGVGMRNFVQGGRLGKGGESLVVRVGE